MLLTATPIVDAKSKERLKSFITALQRESLSRNRFKIDEKTKNKSCPKLAVE